MPSAELRARLAELDDLGVAARVLGWDQQVLMPPGGAARRGEVLATLESLGHARLTDPGLAEALREAAGEEDGRLLAVVGRDVDRATRVPAALVAEMARASTAGHEPWLAAREARDFSIFAPYLQRNLELRRELAACFPEVEHPYDALLADFEPGMTTARLRGLFAELRAGLVGLIAELAQVGAPVLPGPFPAAQQRELGLRMARALGFEDEHWRLDDAVHPFATDFGPQDMRVTARFPEHNLSGLFAVLHEMGHGLYDHQVDPSLARTTAGTGVSLGMHESQSHLWENVVGRSRPFWEHWHPALVAVFGAPALGAGVELEPFLAAINAVRPSLIRVEADEATYPLHVLLRFELEVALVEGTLAVADLPGAWADGMRDLLGIEVPHDTVGVLQDVHWAFGELGYFPTYAIGTVVAAQLWEALRADEPEVEDALRRGDCGPVRRWLREHVHRHGRLLSSAELLQAATGSPELDATALLDGLRVRYGAHRAGARG